MNNNTQNAADINQPAKSGRGRPSGPTFILVDASQLANLSVKIPVSSKFAEMYGIGGEAFGAKPKDYAALAPSKMQVDKVDFASKPAPTATQNESEEVVNIQEEVAV